jgi:hypothetical protein
MREKCVRNRQFIGEFLNIITMGQNFQNQEKSLILKFTIYLVSLPFYPEYNSVSTWLIQKSKKGSKLVPNCIYFNAEFVNFLFARLK